MKNHQRSIKKLALRKSVVRELLSDDLTLVAGGGSGLPTAGFEGYGNGCSGDVPCKQN